MPPKVASVNADLDKLRVAGDLVGGRSHASIRQISSLVKETT